MGGFIKRWIITFVSVLVVALLLPDLISYSDLPGVAIFAAVLALLNAFIRPILLILTLPINILTLGLFVLVVNAFLFWLAARIYPGVAVDGYLETFLAALLVSIVGFVVNKVIR